MPDKKIIRKKMLAMRNALSPEDVAVYSEQIAKLVTSSVEYMNCKHICVYQAFRNEVSCDSIISKAFSDDKQVYVPVTDMETKTMEFYQITPETIWKEGNYGILEPVLAKDSLILQEPAVILMPGLAFDHNKHRLGYGGGYYDKYLAVHKEHVTMALCYDFQIVDELPREEHDILPDYIVTEQGMLF